MPKKTSRSARALQAQRTALSGERRTAARPLIDVNNSRLAAQAEADLEDSTDDFEVAPEPRTAPVPQPALSTARMVSATGARPLNESRPAAASNGSNVIRPASGSSRRPIARRTTTVVNRAPLISREEEYAFIRTDLLTVFALTVLMIIVLVVLTFVIGR